MARSHAAAPFAAAIGAVVAAASSWLITAALAVIGWLPVSDAIAVDAPLRLGTQLWLVAHGAVVDLGELRLSVAPLSVTLGAFMLCAALSRFAARWIGDGGRPWRAAGVVAGSFTAAYLLPVMVCAVIWADHPTLWRPALVTGLVALLGSLVGVCRGQNISLIDEMPEWLKPVPRAVLAGVGVMGVVGLAVVVTGLVRRWPQVVALHQSFGPTGVDAFLLVVLQLAWLPNFIAYTASWALGAGFQIGMDTVISPGGNQVGLLPGLPIFAALPDAGPPPSSTLWWLASGAVAGVVTALLVVRARPAGRVDEVALTGGLAGVVAGLVVTGVAACAGGALGVDRLTYVGVRLGPLAVMAPVVMGLAGMATGLVVGLIRRRPAAEDD